MCICQEFIVWEMTIMTFLTLCRIFSKYVITYASDFNIIYVMVHLFASIIALL